MAESKEELKSLLMWEKVKEESEKVGLKLNVQKMKIVASGPITSWEIDGETVSDFILGWKRLWCWEGLWVEGEGDNRGWDGWMASPTWRMWAWVNSVRWWWTGRPGVLQFMGLQRVGHDWATEMNWTELNWSISVNFYKIQKAVFDPCNALFDIFAMGIFLAMQFFMVYQGLFGSSETAASAWDLKHPP